MSLLHVSKLVDGREVYTNPDGSTTENRDKAEIWHDPKEARAAADAAGGIVSDAFDEDDDRDLEADYI